MFKAFTHKELLEITRNYKLYIILIAFAAFGFSNPIFAKLTPEILATTGYQINLPEPTAIDSWLQFYKNISTLLILFIILFSTSISNELSTNSVINMITKGLPRQTIILSKFTIISTTWLIAYYLCFIITYFYTPLLLDGQLDNLLIASLFPAIFGIFLISLSLFGGVLTKHTIGSLIIPLVVYIAMSLLAIFDNIVKYLPTSLNSESIKLLTNEIELDYFTPSVLITFGLIIITISCTILIFNKQQL